MPPDSRIENIREMALSRRVEITLHARDEMLDDHVDVPSLVSALTSDSVEMIEDYPEDTRGHSHLLLGWLKSNEPCHICCALREDKLIIITVYRPDPEFWTTDWRKRT